MNNIELNGNIKLFIIFRGQLKPMLTIAVYNPKVGNTEKKSNDNILSHDCPVINISRAPDKTSSLEFFKGLCTPMSEYSLSALKIFFFWSTSLKGKAIVLI